MFAQVSDAAASLGNGFLSVVFDGNISNIFLGNDIIIGDRVTSTASAAVGGREIFGVPGAIAPERFSVPPAAVTTGISCSLPFLAQRIISSIVSYFEIVFPDTSTANAAISGVESFGIPGSIAVSWVGGVPITAISGDVALGLPLPAARLVPDLS